MPLAAHRRRRSARGGRSRPRPGSVTRSTRRAESRRHELLDVPADLGAGTAAELQAGCGVGEDARVDVGRVQSAPPEPGRGGRRRAPRPRRTRCRRRAPRRRRRWCRRPRGPAARRHRRWRRRAGGRRGSPRAVRTARCRRSGCRARRPASPTSHASPHSSSTSRASATDGCSPWSMPPPGRVHGPGARPAAESRVSRTCRSSPRRAARRRTPPPAAAGRAGGRRAPRPPAPRSGRRRRRCRRTASRPASTVDPSTSTTRGSGASGGDPAVVDDADRVGVHQPPVARGARQVGAVDAGGLAHRRVEPGLLVDLAHDRGPRVLAVVHPAAREGPQLGARDLRREPAQQHLDPAAVLAEHDGVRPHALSLRKGCHAPNLVK